MRAILDDGRDTLACSAAPARHHVLVFTDHTDDQAGTARPSAVIVVDPRSRRGEGARP